MRTQARAVVIGGGVVGVSTLYHLAKKGWSDVVLVERKELTSGSTWHAAGPPAALQHELLGRPDPQILGRPLPQARSGNRPECRLSAGLEHPPRAHERPHGRVPVLQGRRRDDRHRGEAPHARAGEGSSGRSARPTASSAPSSIPADGYIQPADLTQALAKGARALGAEINRNTVVTAIERSAGGGWVVKTDKGDIACEHVVACTGNFARRTGAMVGLDIPVIPVEHQYIVTEPHPAIVERQRKGLPEMGVLREADSSWYMREENGGLLLGPYEKGAPCCYVDGPSPQSEYELFQEDLDRLAPHIETAIARVPAFGEVGIKKVYNGAIAYTPDGSPIIGPAWDLPNFWLNEGHSFGVTAAGGAGWQIAEWIVEGEPSIDMLGVDPRRFGPYATKGYLKVKNEEAYANVFTPHYPDEERPAGAAAEDRALAMTACETSARCSARSMAGSGRTGSRPRAMASTFPRSKSPMCSRTRTTRGPTRTAR